MSALARLIEAATRLPWRVVQLPVNVAIRNIEDRYVLESAYRRMTEIDANFIVTLANAAPEIDALVGAIENSAPTHDIERDDKSLRIDRADWIAILNAKSALAAKLDVGGAQ